MATPATLNTVWAQAARRALTLPWIAASCAVMVVPMLLPSTKGIAMFRAPFQSWPNAPPMASNWTIATAAELLWMSIVTTVPARMARIG